MVAACALAPSASAQKLHVLSSSFGSFSVNTSVAVDQESGHIYVSDQGVPAVYNFDPSGQLDSTTPRLTGAPFECPQGVGIDNSGTATNGDIYVADSCKEAVYRFDPAGAFIESVASETAIPAPDKGNGTFHATGLATDASGNIYVADYENAVVDEFSPTGAFVKQLGAGHLQSPENIALNAAGDLYVADRSLGLIEFAPDGSCVNSCTPILAGGVGAVAVDGQGNVYGYSESEPPVSEFDSTGTLIERFGSGAIQDNVFGMAVNDSSGLVYVSDIFSAVRVFTPIIVPNVTTGAPTSLNRTDITLTGEVDPVEGGAVTQCQFEFVPAALFEESGYSDVPQHDIAPCSPATPYAAPAVVSSSLTKLESNTTYHYRLKAANGMGAGYGEDKTFITGAAVSEVDTGEASNLETTDATLHGSLNPDGLETHYYFEYGNDLHYGHYSTQPPGSVVGLQSSPISVESTLSELEAGTVYHYRLVAENDFGTTYGPDQTFSTPRPPTIESTYTTNLTETSAEIHALINPHGFATSYRIDYGRTTAYGAQLPNPAGTLPASSTTQNVVFHLDNLERNQTYHFQVTAKSEWGAMTTEDTSFNFFPPTSCPNATVRQETGAEYLPDCRAYELVSPSEAGNFILFHYAPATPYEDNRYAFAGALGAIKGTDPTNGGTTAFDIYVATRTNGGWKTTYAGLKGDEAIQAGHTVTNLQLTRLIDFNEPFAAFLSSGTEDYLPYAWNAETGASLGQWPENAYGSIPGAGESYGAYQPSPDFSHMAFSSAEVAFAPGSNPNPPGTAYDYETATDTTTVISKQPDGAAIPPGTTGEQKEYINFPGTYRDAQSKPTQYHPGVSTDGSHILMSVDGVNGVKLYMRVNDAVTYDVSMDEMKHEPAYVNYVGMTPDGLHVYFTTSEALTPADQDDSVDLYEWSDTGTGNGELTLLSLGSNGSGNSDNCSASWVAKCDVMPVQGWAETDNAIAKNGDIYFYSPEQLDGAKGIENGQNLYDYRNGRSQFVASFAPKVQCDPTPFSGACANGPVGRIQVTPTDSRAAILTATPLTSYDNEAANKICSSRRKANEKLEVISGPSCLEMYAYSPANGSSICVSCDPTGEPPIGDTIASREGLFMSDDGRVFFYTPNALVPQDTNDIGDVYEYVEGHAQLITTGTGALATSITKGNDRPAGLEGVTADGTNVFFSSYNTLVGQDRNGNFAKMYDARTGGGFEYVPPPAPCAAADECHGAGTAPPPPLPNGTGAAVGAGGNLARKGARKKQHHPGRKRRKHRTRHGAGSGRAKGGQ